METVTLGEQSQGHEEGLSRINYKSDFPLAVKLVKNGQPVAFPDCDFSIAAKTENGFTVYKAERKNGVCKHCKQDGDRLIVFFDNHGLGKGRIEVECVIDNPDADYTEDGIRQETYKAKAPIILVDDNGDALDLRLPEPRVVEKVVEKEVPLSAEIKELSEAESKAIEYSPDASLMNIFSSEESSVLRALAAQELIKHPNTILHDGTLAESLLNEFATEGNDIIKQISFITQMSRIELIRLYVQSSTINVCLNCRCIFTGIYFNNMCLTLRSQMDIQQMFTGSYFNRLGIYLTDGFEIANNMSVAVNSESSHEDWVNYRDYEESDKLTNYEYGGHIGLLHLKFDPNKIEHTITLIRKLGFGCVRQINLEPTGEVDGPTFGKWLFEALRPYTDREKAIKDANGQPFMPMISAIGEHIGSGGIYYPQCREEYLTKGYVFS